MRHEKTVSVSKIRLLWEPWKEDETPRKTQSKKGRFSLRDIFWQDISKNNFVLSETTGQILKKTKPVPRCRPKMAVRHLRGVPEHSICIAFGPRDI
jgi:hypothetical protein